MKANYQDNIDMYLSGRMPFVDRFNFETELEQNPDLQKQYEFTLSLQSELQDRKAKMSIINSWKDELSNYSGDSSDNFTEESALIPLANKKRIWYRRVGWVAAAAFLIWFFISLPDSNKHHYEHNQGITESQAEESFVHSSQFNAHHTAEVVSHDLTSPIEKLSLQQQEKYWQRAQYYRVQGQREECIRCLRVLLQQEGLYHQKADSLLHVIYQSQE